MKGGVYRMLTKETGGLAENGDIRFRTFRTEHVQ